MCADSVSPAVVRSSPSQRLDRRPALGLTDGPCARPTTSAGSARWRSHSGWAPRSWASARPLLPRPAAAIPPARPGMSPAARELSTRARQHPGRQPPGRTRCGAGRRTRIGSGRPDQRGGQRRHRPDHRAAPCRRTLHSCRAEHPGPQRRSGLALRHRRVRRGACTGHRRPTAAQRAWLTTRCRRGSESYCRPSQAEAHSPRPQLRPRSSPPGRSRAPQRSRNRPSWPRPHRTARWPHPTPTPRPCSARTAADCPAPRPWLGRTRRGAAGGSGRGDTGGGSSGRGGRGGDRGYHRRCCANHHNRRTLDLLGSSGHHNQDHR